MRFAEAIGELLIPSAEAQVACVALNPVILIPALIIAGVWASLPDAKKQELINSAGVIITATGDVIDKTGQVIANTIKDGIIVTNDGAVADAGAKTVEDLIKDSTPGRETKGRSKQYDKLGSFEDANQDFDDLQPRNVKDDGNGTRVGTLPNGDTIIVRPESSNESRDPTLEIQKNGSKAKIKFRYKN